LKNILGDRTAKEIKDLSDALSKHRKDFLDHAIIVTEMTAIQILDGVGIVSAKANWISARLEWVSNWVSEAGTSERRLLGFMGYLSENRHRTRQKNR